MTLPLFVAPADILNTTGLNEKSLCQIEAATFLSYCSLCLSSCSHGNSDVSSDEGDIASKVHDTLIGILEDLSKPVHVHIVSVLNLRTHVLLASSSL